MKNCELSDETQLKEHNIISGFFLTKVNNLILIRKKHQTDPNKGHSMKLLLVILKKAKATKSRRRNCPD